MKKLTYEFVSNYFTENNCTLLESEYHGNLKKIRYICQCGEPSVTTFASFQKGTRCKKCGLDKLRKKFQLSHQQVKEFFEKHGCVLLEKTYVNAQTAMNYICVCGKPDKKTYANFYNGQRCKECGNKKNAERQRFSFDYVYKYFENNGCILLESNYKNNMQLLNYICECGNYSQTSFANFQKGVRCKDCGIEKIKGENNYNWQGGITQLQNYLRSQIYSWKIESLKTNNYTCAISGQKGGNLEVHHLYPFNKIIDEVMISLNLPIYDSMSLYTKEEVSLIDKRFHELHSSYGLGIPVEKIIHDEFHSIYGKVNFTPKDFEEFKQIKLMQLSDQSA
jgi:hypothetical protein